MPIRQLWGENITYEGAIKWNRWNYKARIYYRVWVDDFDVASRLKLWSNSFRGGSTANYFGILPLRSHIGVNNEFAELTCDLSNEELENTDTGEIKTKNTHCNIVSKQKIRLKNALIIICNG